KHYQANQRQPVQVQNLADEIKRQGPRTALAVTFLNRGSNISFGTDSSTITPETKITGDLRLLEEASFGKMVKKTREMLLRRSMAATRNLFLGEGQEEVSWLIDSVYSLGSEEVKAEWKKCIDRSSTDLTGSITAARSLVESACKQILDAHGIQYSAASKLPVLYGFVRKELLLDPSGEADEAMRTILQGCATVVNGLAELRNKHGDSHGKAPGSAKPALRHARLAVAFAGAMADFLLSTDDARKKP
ncbi:MAG: abortive infection family protein, partial [Burkholderiales bacterium]